MSRVKSKKYTGVYLNKLDNNDISYSIVYKNLDNKNTRFTVGKKSAGITETYAFNKRNEFINIIKLGEEPPAVVKKKKKNIITLDSVADDSYKIKEVHNRDNFHSKRKYLNHISPTLGNRNIKSITANDIQKLQSAKLKELAPKTVNNILGELNTVFHYALDKEIISFNPAKKVKKLKLNNSRDRYLNKDEIKLLLDAVRDNEQLYIFVLIALTTGARFNAITLLTPRDINFETKTINILDEKNNEHYTAFLGSEELESILRIRTKKMKLDTPLLQESTFNQYLQIRNKLSKILNDLFNEGVTGSKHKVVIHTLRHTFASNLAINGTPIFTIQKLLNHKDINMTLRYAKLAPDSGRKSVEELGL